MQLRMVRLQQGQTIHVPTGGSIYIMLAINRSYLPHLNQSLGVGPLHSKPFQLCDEVGDINYDFA